MAHVIVIGAGLCGMLAAFDLRKSLKRAMTDGAHDVRSTFTP